MTPGPDQAPVTTASNVILDHSQTSVAASSLFAVNDPEGDTITQYDVWNSGTGGGHFELNGQALGANQHNYVTAAQLSQLSYVAGTGADTLWVRASDGTKWSGWTSGGFTVNRPDQAPVTTVSNVILDHGQTSLAASSLFTANDPEGDTITQYAVWNSRHRRRAFRAQRPSAGRASQANYVTAAQLSQLSYVAGSGADTLWVRAF